MITRERGHIEPRPFSEVLDRETGRTRVRMLDVSSPSYSMARALQVRLEKSDFDDARLTQRFEDATDRPIDFLRSRWDSALV